MTRLAAAWALACAAVAAVVTVAAQDAPTFRSQANSVSVDVSVRQRGRPVTGLTLDDFRLTDNGAAQTLSNLSFERLPIDVTVALDVSDSVSGSVIERLRRAVRQLENDLTPRDRLRLVTFNLRISRVLDFDTRASADDVVAKIQPFGGTAIFDTIAVLLAAPSVPDRRQLIVVFSDGEDSNSVSVPQVLVDVARRTTPTLSVVLSRPAARAAPPSSAAEARAQLYTDLARETGGIVESLAPNANLSSAFTRMLDEFRSSYVLHFVPSAAAPGFHTIDVTVDRPGVDVRARRGYTLK